MPITHLRPSFTFDDDRLAALRALVPEAFADGRINWDTLHEALGDHLEDEAADAEHFGLFWPGKRQARRLAVRPPDGALVPCPGQGVDEAATRNLFIEGENLEVLKLLLKSYAGQVKMIYIDPPYNTGNDFIYSDDFTESLDAYLRRTAQADERGALLTTNPRASGRFHSNWLSMIYPRLLLARHMMRDDGVILVSIDDNEVHELRALLNEVFGEENFVATFTWETKRAARGVPPTNLLMANHEYVVCYARVADQVRFRGLDRQETDFGNPDSDPRGLWRSESMKATGSQDNYLTITDPATGYQYYANWAFSESSINRMIAEGLVLFPGRPDGVPRQKKFLDSYTNETKAAVTALGWHSTELATKQFMTLFDGRKIFDFPKPLSLLQFLCSQALEASDLILDFFAGSGGVGQAVFELNAQDLGARQWLLVQLPEPCDATTEAYKAGYSTVAEIAKERLRRAGKKVRTENPLFAGDLGFRAFRLDRSHFRRWRDYEGDSPADVQTLFDRFETPLVDGWQPADLLVEILLLEGFPLDSTVTPQPAFPHNTVHLVESDWCDHCLFVCLDPTIHDDTVAHLSLAGQDVFVCLDSALTDQAKLRLADRCNLKVI
jgi:adenine-specific DNA-methyltransferase